MGDPKQSRKKYQTPSHPWNKDAIDQQKLLNKEFGLKSRKEILIAQSLLKSYKDRAKKLIADKSAQGGKEKTQMMDKLQRLGLLTTGAPLDSILSLELKDVLNRRLQSIIIRRGLARTVKQARQFITHRHITINSKEITSPGYLVSLNDEAALTFKLNSPLVSESHPERMSIAKEVKEVKEEVAAIKDFQKKAVKKAEEEPGVIPVESAA